MPTTFATKKPEPILPGATAFIEPAQVRRSLWPYRFLVSLPDMRGKGPYPMVKCLCGKLNP
jgi:hypothetical protein